MSLREYPPSNASREAGSTRETKRRSKPPSHENFSTGKQLCAIIRAMLKTDSSIPETSSTLLLQLGKDANHARWTEFVARYRPMMEQYLSKQFPNLESDDIIQETFIALVKVLPNYHYAPEETGYFHNYLTGILRRKALRQVTKETRVADHLAEATQNATPAPHTFNAQEDEAWKQTIFEIALQQLLQDETIAPRTREVFRALVLAHRDPVEVGNAFGLKRNAVDQIKNRLLTKLREKVEQLKTII